MVPQAAIHWATPLILGLQPPVLSRIGSPQKCPQLNFTMKTTFIYGLSMAIAGSLMNFMFYFLGFHDSPEKIGTGQMIGLIGGMVITIGGLILAVKARRSEVSESEDFGYGKALGAGVLTSLWASIFGTISNVVYMGFINPGMQEVVIESEITKLEAKGMSAEQIDQAEGMIRMMTSPAASGIMGFIGAFVISVIISLIIAAILKRPAQDSIPSL